MLEQNLAKIVEKGVHLDAIFGKWIVGTLVMIYLYHSINFSQLNRELKRITPKVLSSKLKDLEEMGLIGKKILLEHPLRVEYYITSKGEEFAENVIKTFNLDAISAEKKRN